MSEKKQSEIDAERRRERQDAQLRENLKRRKDQARARRSGSPGAGDGPPPPEDGGGPAVEGNGDDA